MRLLFAFFLSFAFANIISANVTFVDQAATGLADGSSWANAYTDLQIALLNASSGDTIWIAEGVYVPTTTSDRFASFVLIDGLALYGGFDGTESNLNERNWEVHPTILSGDIGTTASNSDNTYRIVQIINADNITIDGLHILDANNNNPHPNPEQHTGGGIYAKNTNLSLYNVTIRDNTARLGGGIGLFGSSSLHVEGSTFDNNISNGSNDKCGGAVFAESNDNEASYLNTRFLRNKVTFPGGSGGACTGGTNIFINCIFSSNEAPLGMALSFMEASIYQSTLWNHMGNMGLFSDGSYEMYNSICWNNASNSIALGGTCIIKDCMLGTLTCPVGTSCSGNMIYSTPPYFVHPYGDDFRLSLCSPAVDMGNNTNIPVGVVTDAAGLDRVLYNAVDLGAHEMIDIEPQYRPTDVRNLDSTYYNRSWLAALLCAEQHSGADTVRFVLDSGPPHIIQARYHSPCLLDDSTIIDATIGYDLGDIIIDGSEHNRSDFQIFCTPGDAEALYINGNDFEIYGITMRNFIKPAILLGANSAGALIGRPEKGNIFYNNGSGTPAFSYNLIISGSGHRVQSNYVGTTPSGDVQSGFAGGISIGKGASNILIGGTSTLNEGNIFGYCSSAVSLGFANDGGLAFQHIKVSGNHFGLDPNTGNICPNKTAFGGSVQNGSYYDDVSFGGTLAEGNIVAYSENQGVLVLGTGTEVAINRNTFICNQEGIDLESFTAGQNGNYGIFPPFITNADIFHLKGTAGSGDTVEVYINEILDCPEAVDCNQGRIYFGERIANAAGEWEIIATDFPFPLYGGEQVTAIRTNSIPVTSEFSPCKEVICPESYGTYTTTLCPSDSVVINGTSYNFQNPNGIETFIDASSIGCDSIVTVNINFLEEPMGSFDTTICESLTLLIGDTEFNIDNPSGVATLTSAAANGCDSLVQVNLDFELNIQTLLSEQICSGDTLFYNDESLTENGEYTFFFPAANSCDSIVTLQLQLIPPVFSSQQVSICEGDTLIFNGEALSETGDYSFTLSAANGCDSIVNLQLSLIPPIFSSQQTSICEGDTLIFNGQSLTQAGIYDANLTASNGCDSVISLELLILPIQETSISASFCESSTYTFCGNEYDIPGQYECTLTSSSGCDSIVTLNLQQQFATDGFLDTTICEDELLELNGLVYSSAGMYEQLLENTAGCDSTLFISLTTQSLATPETIIEPDLGFGDGSIAVSLVDTSMTFVWEDGSTDSFRQQLFAGEYLLTLIDSLGCTLEIILLVEEEKLIVAVPNVFTPNGDGHNDFFNVVSNAESVQVLQFAIYNRWGQQVYDNNSPDTGWDGLFEGEPQPIETYFYFIEVDGGKKGQKATIFQGNVSLVR